MELEESNQGQVRLIGFQNCCNLKHAKFFWIWSF